MTPTLKPTVLYVSTTHTFYFLVISFPAFSGCYLCRRLTLGCPAPPIHSLCFDLSDVLTKHQLIFINTGTRRPLAVRGCDWSKHFTLVIERMKECFGVEGRAPDVYKGLGVSLVPLSADAIVRSRNGWWYKLTYYQQRFRTPSVFPSVWGSNGAQVGRAVEWVSLQWFSRKVSPWWLI